VLENTKPTDVRSLFGLLARQIRWVLLDFGRKQAANKVVLRAAADVAGLQGSNAGPVDPAGEPSDLVEWTHFHESIESLPGDELEMFDLLFYQGISQADAAKLLQVSTRTIKRRWQAARLLLKEKLDGQFGKWM